MDKKKLFFLDNSQKWKDTVNVNANISKNRLLGGYYKEYRDNHEMLTLKLQYFGKEEEKFLDDIMSGNALSSIGSKEEKMPKPVKVLLVGETWFVLKLHIKGFDMVPLGGYENFSVWFMNALKQYDDLAVTHMPNHVALSEFPSSVDALEQYDVVIFSDVGKNTIQLYPDMFTVPMGPDRLDVVRDFVAKGHGFCMGGGWNCFEGIRGIPGYHDTTVEKILPVNMLPYDDRVEKPQGVTPVVVDSHHPVMAGIDGSWPLFLGYNKVEAKDESQLIATIDGNPFIVGGSYGKGRTMAFTSDLSKHWGTAFIEWKYYAKFWRNAILWLSGKN